MATADGRRHGGAPGVLEGTVRVLQGCSGVLQGQQTGAGTVHCRRKEWMYTSPGPDVADHDAIYSEQKPDAAERTRRYERRGGSQARHRPRPQT